MVLFLILVFVPGFDVNDCPSSPMNCQSSMVALTDLPSPLVHLDHSNRSLCWADDFIWVQLFQLLVTTTSLQMTFVYLSNAVGPIIEC